MASRIDMSAYSIVVWCSNCPTFSSGASDETEALSIANTHNKRENHKAATRLPRQRKQKATR